ncbi:hypothetical protein DOY81_006014 [Sarcophaga bullata]|nr:hypothetical protein DOY81_006014 [Sarcophaga bullata]
MSLKIKTLTHYCDLSLNSITIVIVFPYLSIALLLVALYNMTGTRAAENNNSN